MPDEKPERKRRGRAIKTRRGVAATFEAGAGASPRDFDAGRLADELHLWWEDGDGQTFIIGQNPQPSYWTRRRGKADELISDAPQTWSRWPEKKIVNLLRLKYVRLKAREDEMLSEAERLLLYVMEKRRLGLAISSLAGYPAGIHTIGGEQVLVRTSPRLVEPKEAPWETVKALIETKLDLSQGVGGGPDQTPYFHGWMKIALEGLYLGGPENFRPGQCCIFAGRANSMKSRLQHQIITGLLGGRSADPGPYLFGRTDFNGEMFAAEHLMMEDPTSGTKTVDRIFFGEMLKGLVVNDTQRLHRKREDAITVSPFFRTTISINDDPDKMRVLPLLTPDMKDKVNLFLVSDRPFAIPTTTLEERATFRGKIAEELPAYAWWLLNVFAITPAMASIRFGVKEWHHPALMTELFDDTPAAELLQIIDAADFTASEGTAGSKYKLWEVESDSKEMGESWEGTALDLEKLLLGEGGWVCSLAREAKKVAMHNKVDRLLARLEQDQPERVMRHRTKAKRGWVISRMQ